MIDKVHLFCTKFLHHIETMRVFCGKCWSLTDCHKDFILLFSALYFVCLKTFKNNLTWENFEAKLLPLSKYSSKYLKHSLKEWSLWTQLNTRIIMKCQSDDTIYNCPFIWTQTWYSLKHNLRWQENKIRKMISISFSTRQSFIIVKLL